MKQFFSDIFRGVLVGIIVWYILKPDEPAFDRLEEAIDDSKEIGETFIEPLLDYPSEHMLTAGGYGLLLGVLLWLVRSKLKTGNRAKPRVAAPRKQKKQARRK